LLSVLYLQVNYFPIPTGISVFSCPIMLHLQYMMCMCVYQKTRKSTVRATLKMKSGNDKPRKAKFFWSLT